ncbi:MAG: HD domain-containing protein [Candidatus Taylorbacteria bacterium]|nr:HD domain-containing protein [Candidatus Taylorbacteria bacterium]
MGKEAIPKTNEQKTEALKDEVLKKLEDMEGKEKIIEALELALFLHSDQRPRPDGPYVDHILRGVNRLLGFGVTDPDIIIASALHDSVEDQSSKLAEGAISELSEREKAIESIRQKYGQRVSNIVESITNPEKLKELQAEQANEEYAVRLKEVIENLDTFYVKLSDFLDNGSKIKDIADARWQYKLAKKYLPIYKIFIDRIKRSDIILPQEIKDQIITDLSEAEIVATGIIKG